MSLTESTIPPAEAKVEAEESDSFALSLSLTDLLRQLLIYMLPYRFQLRYQWEFEYCQGCRQKPLQFNRYCCPCCRSKCGGTSKASSVATVFDMAINLAVPAVTDSLEVPVDAVKVLLPSPSPHTR